MTYDLLELQSGIKRKNICDFEFLSYSNFELKIAGSFDFAYYHNVEIIFHGVSFVMCSTKFHDATIRLATEDERSCLIENYKIDYMEEDEIVFCFEREKSENYFIVAEGFSYNFDIVLYYKKENLVEGQRLADWVK
jgi:hypothetical protein